MTDSHTANFSRAIDQSKDLMLAFIWSTYSAGTVRDYNFNVTYIPAFAVGSSSVMKGGVSSIHTVGDSDKDARKVIYISNGKATGAAANEQGNAAYYVLREIWAIG